ncbi:hypothetical protein ACEE76_07205 [Streptococcus hyovaginalis]
MTKEDILESLEAEYGQFWNDDKREEVLKQPTTAFLKILAEWQDMVSVGGRVIYD